MQEIWVRSLGQEDPLKKERATHSSILTWEISWTEERGRLQFMGLPRAGHDLAAKQQLQVLFSLYFLTLLYLTQSRYSVKTNLKKKRHHYLQSWMKLVTYLSQTLFIASDFFLFFLEPTASEFPLFLHKNIFVRIHQRPLWLCLIQLSVISLHWPISSIWIQVIVPSSLEHFICLTCGTLFSPSFSLKSLIASSQFFLLIPSHISVFSGESRATSLVLFSLNLLPSVISPDFMALNTTVPWWILTISF